jgi:beta-lactamase superfamily II metal-dependent hydrolase
MMNLPELAILDVGQGNCAILQDTNAITVIDCPPGTILLETLESLGISAVDQVLISHADKDHVGGLITLLDSIQIRNVFINPDADKRSISWKETRIALNQAANKGTQVHIGLTSSLSRTIESGEVEIEILAPSIALVLSGAGGEDLQGRPLTSNSMSVVIGLIHASHRIALLPGDMDEVGLDNLLNQQKNIEAQILIFPHHGGLPGTGDARQFAQNLCGLVKPRLVIFSHDRDIFEFPREDVVQGVLAAAPDAHIICTQLSRKCSVELPDIRFDHLTTLPSKGRARGKCCGGSILVKIDGVQTTYAPLLPSHRAFVANNRNVLQPMCLQYLGKAKLPIG